MGKLTDGYLVDDLIIYRGLQKGGHIGRGFRVHPPDDENADISWLNRLEDEMRVLLASLKDTARMQFHWSVDSDYQRELLAYYAKSKELATNAWSRRQRDERFTRYWKLMEERKLRRERLHIYVTSKIEASIPHKGKGKGEDEIEGKDKSGHYDYLLDASARELDQYGELLEQIFGGLGGSVRPLDERGHFEEFYRYFNASAPDCPDIDYAALYDPDKGIIENCFNGEAAPLSKPDMGFYLDGYYHGNLAIKSLPKTTFSGMIGQLTGLDMLDYSITVNIRPLDVMKEIEREEGPTKNCRTPSSIHPNCACSRRCGRRARRFRGSCPTRCFPTRRNSSCAAGIRTRQACAPSWPRCAAPSPRSAVPSTTTRRCRPAHATTSTLPFPDGAGTNTTTTPTTSRTPTSRACCRFPPHPPATWPMPKPSTTEPTATLLA
ncbi:MAG: hypothetical protein R3F19_18170 [Verrucomicrobiales bacterium]